MTNVSLYAMPTRWAVELPYCRTGKMASTMLLLAHRRSVLSNMVRHHEMDDLQQV